MSRNETFKRVIWIILDSVGIGEEPDADEFDDTGADTLGHIYQYKKDIKLPNLEKLGLRNIDDTSLPSQKADFETIGIYGKAREMSRGKDTTIGHWEMTGIVSKIPFKTYPDGFPKEVIDEFVRQTGVPGILGNCVASGTEIIKDFGKEHIETKKPIIYTSADSVFQIACHEGIYKIEELYDMCEKARKILLGENSVARVIARPFEGEYPYVRTSNRRDYSLEPDKDNLLNYLKNAGIEVAAVGKIEDIFAKCGITRAIHTKDNEDGVDKTLMYMSEINSGLIFTNLVDFDSKWGHRRDVLGYANGLEAFDMRLKEILEALRDDDLLIINADHGCDPMFKGTDHTREYIPVLIYSKAIKKSTNLGTLSTFADIGATIADNFGVKELKDGKTFLKQIEEACYASI